MHEIERLQYKYKWNAETTVSVHMGHALSSVLLRAHFSAALHIGQVKAQDILSE